MAYISHLHFPTPISYYTTPKTPNTIFSFHNILPFPTSILRSLSQPKSISLPRRSLSRSATDNDDELPEELENQIDDYSDDDDVDVIALEREAKEVALEYSSSLSRVLTIGESLCFIRNWLNFSFLTFVCLIISEDERSDVKETGKNSKRSKPKRKIVSIFFQLILSIQCLRTMKHSQGH